MPCETISMQAFELMTAFFLWIWAAALILTLANKTFFVQAVTVDSGPQF